MGNVRVWQRRHDEALTELHRAVELDHNYAQGHALLGMALMYSAHHMVLVFCDAITRAWKQIIYFHPSEAAEARPAGARSRRPPASTCRTATASSATSAASASCRTADGTPMADRCIPPGSLAVIGGRLEDNNVAVFARDLPPRRRPHPRLPHRLRRARGRRAQESLAAVPRPRLRRRGGAASPRQRRAARRTTPALVARVAAYGSVYFTGGDQAQDRRRPGAGRGGDAAPRRDPRAPAPPAGWSRGRAPGRR